MIKSVLLNKNNQMGFAHLHCATTEELKHCILEIAKREKSFYDDLMKVASDFEIDKIREFERKYGDFDEAMDYTPSDPQLMVAALLHELKKKKKSG